MKVIQISKKSILKFSMFFLVVSIICLATKSFGIQNYYKVDFSTGLVTATTLNVRSGPSTGYSIVTTVKKNQYLRVFAGVGDWYIVQVEGDFVGAVSKKYVKPIYPSSNNSNTNSNTKQTSNQGTLSADEKEVFDLVNKQRTNNGLTELKMDLEAFNVASIKAKDMVEKNYFAHESPTYGSPFDMLKSFKISYKSAGENLAGNSSNSGAITAWMNSPGHRANILNSSYNYTGVGVVSSPKYGKIYVQIFLGK